MFVRKKIEILRTKKRVGGKRKEGRGSEGTNPKGAREEEGEEEGANRVVYELTKKRGRPPLRDSDRPSAAFCGKLPPPLFCCCFVHWKRIIHQQTNFELLRL